MRRAQSVLLLLGLMAAACSGGESRIGSTPATTAPTPRVAFVTIGSEATAGSNVDDALHQLWSQQLFANALPPQSVYANLATSGATAADALREQVPVALELRPTVATVWVTGDLDQGTPTPQYEEELTEIVQRLQAADATVLIAYGRPDDAVAERVIRATDAIAVDLEGIARPEPGSAAEQQAIAAAFAAALRSATT